MSSPLVRRRGRALASMTAAALVAGTATFTALSGPASSAPAEDCADRTDCGKGLTDDYGIDVTEFLPLGYASADVFKSVADGESQLGETSTTDGTLESQGMVLLEDDKHVQPAQNLIPAVSSEWLADNPDVEGILNDLMAALTTEKLTELNGQMAVDRAKPEDVAKEFLESEGLLG